MTRLELAVWDFTLSVEKSTDNHTIIIKELEQIAKKWTFQKEQPQEEIYDDDGNIINIQDELLEDDEYIDFEQEEQDEETQEQQEEEEEISDYEYSLSDNSDSDYSTDYDSEEDQQGFIHYQGRISLIKRKSKMALLNLLYQNEFFLSKAHFSPSTTNTMGEIFYVIKLDTRIEGPWKDTDPKPIPIPYALRDITLWNWQQEILDRCKYIRSNRKINVVYCPQGNTGKSTLALWAKVHKFMNALIIPSIMDSFLDLNQAVLSQCIGREQPQLMFLDIPRALPKSKMNQVIGFLESAKIMVYDTRYKYNEIIFLRSPEIVVFVNTKIWENRDLLSNDRWQIWKIKDNELYIYNENPEILEKGIEIIIPDDFSENEELSESEESEGGTLTEDEGGTLENEEIFNIDDYDEIEEFDKVNTLGTNELSKINDFDINTPIEQGKTLKIDA